MKFFEIPLKVFLQTVQIFLQIWIDRSLKILQLFPRWKGNLQLYHQTQTYSFSCSVLFGTSHHSAS